MNTEVIEMIDTVLAIINDEIKYHNEKFNDAKLTVDYKDGFINGLEHIKGILDLMELAEYDESEMIRA